MRRLTRKITSLQLRMHCSVMQVTLVRTTKRIKRKKKKKKNGVAVGAGVEAKVVAEAKAEVEVGVGAEVEVGVGVIAAADPRVVEKVQVIELLSKM